MALLLIVGSGSPAPKGIVRLLDWCNLPHEVLLVLERPVPCEDLFDYVANRSVRLEEEEAKVTTAQTVHLSIPAEVIGPTIFISSAKNKTAYCYMYIIEHKHLVPSGRYLSI